MQRPDEEPPSALLRRADRAARDLELADTRAARNRARVRLIGTGGAALVEGALRTYLLEAAAFFAVIEAVVTGVFAATGVGRSVGIAIGVVTLVFVFWIVRRRRGPREQYLAILAAFVVLSLTLILVRPGG